MKNRFTIKTMPYLTRKELIDIADNGEHWDYNRQLCPEAIRQLPDDAEYVYPVTMNFLHEHRYLEPCELHMRIMIAVTDTVAFADIPLEYFDSLPKSQAILCDNEIVAVLLAKADGSPWRLRYEKMNRTTRGAIRHLLKKSKDQQTKAFLNIHLYIAELET